MKKSKTRVYLCFFSGFLIGFFLSITLRKDPQRNQIYGYETFSNELYDDKLADMLFQEVKILCWVFTHPANHKVRSIHVKNTWGKRCNKLLFMSSEADPDLPIVVISGENDRVHLWNKTQQVYHYVSLLLTAIEFIKFKLFKHRFTRITSTNMTGLCELMMTS
jgi:hypothetical protein